MTTDMDAGLPDLAAIARLYHQNGYKRASVCPGPGSALVLQSDAAAWRQAATLRAQMVADQAAEIARLQAQVAESQQQSDALLARGLDYCDKIEALQAQVDAFAEALRKVSVIGNENGLSRDEYQQRLIAAAGYARAALAAVGR